MKDRLPEPRLIDKLIIHAATVLVGWTSVEFLMRLYGLDDNGSVFAPIFGFLN